MKYADIKQFPAAHDKVNVGYKYLEDWLDNYKQTGLDLDPDFQRCHVWTPKQQKLYVEYILRGGEGSRIIYWNQSGNGLSYHNVLAPLILVDGKQRLEAVRSFMSGKIQAFGHYVSEFTDRMSLSGPDFVMQIACLQTKEQVLEWYLAINAGGTPHTKSELDKVRKLLEIEKNKP